MVGRDEGGAGILAERCVSFCVNQQKSPLKFSGLFEWKTLVFNVLRCRGSRIRTCGPLLPKQVR